eukprot:RCo011242
MSAWARSVAVQELPSRGRGVQAVAPVQAGAELLAEPPFAFVATQEYEPRVCHRCFKEAEDLQTCPRCQRVRYCGRACQTSDSRWHQQECAYLRVRPVTPTLRLALRVLVRLAAEKNGPEDPSAEVARLISHREDIPPERAEMFAQMAALVLDCLWISEGGQSGGPPQGVVEQRPLPSVLVSSGLSSVAALVTLFCQLEVNVFHILNTDLQAVGSGLFLRATSLNHSCSPNAVVTFEGSLLSVRATESIGTGQEVCISYVDVAKTTASRRAELHSRYHFLCECPLCHEVSRDGKLTELRGSSAAAQGRISEAGELVEAGVNHLQRHELTEAREKLLKALSLQKGAVGPLHQCAMETLGSLLRCCIDQQDFSSALKFCSLSMPYYEFVYRGNHPTLALQYYTLGKLAWCEGNVELAFSSLDRALQIYKVTHGSQHCTVAQLSDLLHEVAQARSQLTS